MNTNEFFSENYVLKKKENINDFWKGNKTKSGNKNALQSGRDRYTAKNYNTMRVFPLIPFSLVLLKDFFKICRINSLSSMKYGMNNKKM